MSLSLAAILAEAARRHAARTAIVFEDERIPYRDLWEQARRYAAALAAQGVGPDDRVAILMPNVPDFPRAYFAILALGAVVVPVHGLLTADEVAYVLRDSQAKALICAGPLLTVGATACAATGTPCLTPDRLAAQIEPLAAYVSRAADDAAVVLYTSGTTGAPKGAILTHGNIMWNVHVTAHDLMHAVYDDVFLGALPLFHCFGQVVVMNVGLLVGACVVLVARFDGDRALELMESERVTIWAGVPTMHIALIAAAERHPRKLALRLVKSGGAPLPVAVLERFESIFGVPIFEGYGLTETSPVASFNQSCFGRKAGSVGCAVWGVDIAVAAAEIDDRIELLGDGELGEIVIRGHNVFKGYLNNPEATAAAIVDGWFRTGDLGTRDADGFITIVDRKKDLIIRGGFNVYPREIEEVLMRHPAIAQVAVIGVPHETHGEEVVAVVVARGEDFDGEAIVAWSQQHLGKHKYPRRVERIEALPLGPSGKVLKRELRLQFSAAGVR
ncbi:MAG TPA: long-chain fatty acid--CoA ligase [Candidatus Baltobacteraceae bacterium]|jgi:long-chain acyl-CoA synthetase